MVVAIWRIAARARARPSDCLAHRALRTSPLNPNAASPKEGQSADRGLAVWALRPRPHLPVIWTWRSTFARKGPDPAKEDRVMPYPASPGACRARLVAFEASRSRKPSAVRRIR